MSSFSQKIYLWVVLILWASVPQTEAALKLGSLFQNGLVLQLDKRITVWGWDVPGQQIEVRIGARSGLVRAREGDGWWGCLLEPIPVPGPVPFVVEGSSRKTLEDVLVGEVWLAAGQSNMLEGLGKDPENLAIARRGSSSGVRMFQVKSRAAGAPLAETGGQWVSSADFSGLTPALPALFGARLSRERGVPVGVIVAAVGGSQIQSWVSATAHEEMKADPPSLGRTVPPWPGAYQKGDFRLPGHLFNGFLAPLAPCSLKGVVWYQGESNARPGGGDDYENWLRALIADLGRWWRDDHLFAAGIQLPRFGRLQEAPVERSGWAELRHAQSLVFRGPGRVLVVTTDNVDFDLHPQNKLTVANRLAVKILEGAYGESGFIDQEEQMQGNWMEQEIQIFGALTIESLDTVEGLAVKPEGGDWEWGAAEVKQGKITVVHPEGKPIQEIRYNWANCPRGRLRFSNGLPVGPFRLSRPVDGARP